MGAVMGGAMGGVLFLVAFVYYALRAAGGPPWLDGSELIASGHLLAVPHPTGEPVYLLLTHLVQRLPFGTPALHVAWLSGLFGALSVERVHALGVRLCARDGHEARSVPGRFVGFVPSLAALLFAWTPGMLAISHRAELYSLELWLTLAALERALAFRQTGHAGAARVAGLLLGLALATHPLLAGLALPGLLLVAGRGLLARAVLLPSMALLLPGLATYGLLAVRAHAGGLAGWGDVSTLAGFLDVVLGRAFHKNVGFGAAATPGRSLALFAATHLGVAGTFVVLAGAVAGLVLLLPRRPGNGAAGLGLPIGLALLVLLGVASRVLTPFEVDTPDTFGYLALPIAVLCVLLAPALERLAALATDAPSRLAARAARIGPWALCLLIAIDVGWVPTARLEGRRGRDLGLAALRGLEPNAVLLLGDFNLLFLTWYLQAVERVRPDVLVLYEGSLGRSWYRARVAAVAPAADRWLAGQGPPPGPVYVDYALGAPSLPPALHQALVPAGLFLRVGGPPRAPDPNDWLADVPDLDPQTRRELVWLHFRRGCFHLSRGEAAEARFHADAADALEPGAQVGTMLGSGAERACAVPARNARR